MDKFCKDCQKKISTGSTGRCKSCSRKGVLNHLFGKKMSNSARQKMRENHYDASGSNNPRWGKGENIRGNKNPNWKDGRSAINYPFEFKYVRKEILARDNFTCQSCGTKEKLTVHHINYDRRDSDRANLVTLCKRCNSKQNSKKWCWAHWWHWTEFMIDRNIYRTTPANAGVVEKIIAARELIVPIDLRRS